MNSATLALFLALAVAVASAQFHHGRPVPPIFHHNRPIIPTLQRDETRDHAGQFSLRYVTGDGTNFEEVGRLVPNDEGDGHVLIKEGTYSYTSPEGQRITLSYVSDKTGFKPTGAHLPVPPVA